jgi:hypothetical protein
MRVLQYTDMVERYFKRVKEAGIAVIIAPLGGVLGQ